jgi:hypothetical protein
MGKTTITTKEATNELGARRKRARTNRAAAAVPSADASTSSTSSGMRTNGGSDASSSTPPHHRHDHLPYSMVFERLDEFGGLDGIIENAKGMATLLGVSSPLLALSPLDAAALEEVKQRFEARERMVLTFAIGPLLFTLDISDEPAL